MKHQVLILFLMASLVSWTAQGEEQKQMRLKIAVDKGDESNTSFDFDSDTAGFDLQKMQVGESQTITDSSGRPALLTRTEDGFEFDIDGEKIDVTAISAVHDIDVVEEHENNDGSVRVIRKVKKIEPEDNDADIIIVDTDSSPDDVALHAAKEHKIVVIKEKVDVTN
ncbi:MAG: hypothetical protein OEM85_09575 [Gammaproteobacteria bacterium]|nr:hypothetical protein [Gammaproteobacteria bacterium]MDH3373612.1 hypothetical protein [Gammaproteobacteria bacterium]MDH3409160.1 hypothetical protein [Gammaproteobacteria bacterium]